MSALSRYVLFQVPGWVLCAGIGVALAWEGHPKWWGAALVGIVVLKDALMYPLMRHAYEGAAATGVASMIGEVGTTRDRLEEATGVVRVRGETWRAERAPGAGTIHAGRPIEVTGARGRVLIVAEKKTTRGTMPEYDFDLFTIGAGSGGVRASRISAQYGARVAVAEDRYLGGTCVNVGCVPKKLLVYAAHVRADLEDAAGFGWTISDATNDWNRLIANKNREIERLNGVYRGILERNGVTLVEGRARIVDPHTVAVGDTTYSAKHILVATGGWPTKLDVPGAEHAITSNEAFFLEKFPQRVLMIGGGYISVEFAGIFHGLGAHVTLSYRGKSFLRGFDDDLRTGLADEMGKQGIDLRFESEVTEIRPHGDHYTVTLSTGDSLEVDCVMFATGRHPNTAGIGLEEAGVQLAESGAVIVDDHFQTSVPNIYSIGDCIDRVALTPVAIAEGMCVARTLFQGKPQALDYRDIPSAVFSQPPLGVVGLTEAEARERYGDIDVYRSKFRAMKHTLSGRDEQTIMKLVVDKKSDRVVGCHMMGPDAGEIIQGLGVALQCHATKAQFDATIGIHPTAAEEFVTMRDPE